LEVEAGADDFQVERTEEAFHRRHEALYGFRREYAPVEVLAVKLIAEEEMGEFSMRPAAREGKGSMQVGEREIITEEGKKVLPRYRAALCPAFHSRVLRSSKKRPPRLRSSSWCRGDEYGNHRCRGNLKGLKVSCLGSAHNP
jgi:hypothetical protein